MLFWDWSFSPILSAYKVVAGVGLVSGAKINPGHREKPFLKSIILMESKFCWKVPV